MPRRKLVSTLHQLAEPTYRDFASRLIPGETRLLGVRLPALRRLAREYAAGNWQQLLASPPPPDASFEEILLRAMLPAYAPELALRERLRYLQQEQPNFNNWSLCDSACASCRFVANHREDVFRWLEPFLHSEQEFTARFGVVMLNNYYAADPVWAAMVIAALAAHGTSEISCVQYIERGYEDIVGKLRAVGADIRCVDVPGDESELEAHIG